MHLGVLSLKAGSDSPVGYQCRRSPMAEATHLKRVHVRVRIPWSAPRRGGSTIERLFRKQDLVGLTPTRGSKWTMMQPTERDGNW